MSGSSWLAKETVTSILRASDAQKIKSFAFSGIGFDAKTFPVLAGFIDRGQIKVEYDSGKDGSAEYDYATNTIYLGFRFALSYTERALVVHECVHAVYDVAKTKMSVAVSEAIAYIVQSQFIYANAGPGKRLSSKNPKKDAVFKYAWDLAAKIQEGKPVSQLDKNNLIAVISEHPFYAKNAMADAGFDGV